jgi:hypothetical protein
MRATWLFVVGCAASAPPPPSSHQAPPPQTQARSQPDPAIEYGGPMPGACHGIRVVMASLLGCKCSGKLADPLLAGVKCAPAFYGRNLDGLVDTHLVAPAQLHPADLSTVHLLARNTSAAALPLLVYGPTALTVSIFDARGRDVTNVGGCGAGYSVSGTDFLISLDPGGELDLDIVWKAASYDICKQMWAPLAPGTYKLVVRAFAIRDLPAAQATPSTTIEVVR